MPRPIVVVDPSFPQSLRQLRTERGLSVRALGKLAGYVGQYIHEFETGRKKPSPENAARLDRALGAGGQLAELVAVDSPTAPLDSDEEERLARLADRPRTIDATAVRSLAAILAEQRRLEDVVGSGPLLAPVAAQLEVVEGLVTDARGPIRPLVLEVGAQWAQFLGWLSANSRRDEAARRWYDRALLWATEVDDPNMVATALNLTGHLEWLAGNVGPVVGLSQAAGRQPASPGVRALAAQQEARGHALAGEPDATDEMLDRAVVLAVAAVERPEDEPPWIYYYSPDYLTMQRGLAYRYLGRNREAVRLLENGLRAMPVDVRRSEWVGVYWYHLAHAYADLGERDAARAALVEVDEIAVATGSDRLRRLARKLRQRPGVVC